jgi:hypothetical protein
MKLFIKAAFFSAVTMLASAGQTAQTAIAYQGFLACKARVLHSEELPYAPIGTWLVKATFEITPPQGNPYLATFQDWMPWQGPPPEASLSACSAIRPIRATCISIDPAFEETLVLRTAAAPAFMRFLFFRAPLRLVFQRRFAHIAGRGRIQRPLALRE